MSKLIEWLDHRMDVVGIESWKDLSLYSDVCVEALASVKALGKLEALCRSERRLLAGTLRVSLGKLELLSESKIDWIEDRHFYDAGVRNRPLPWQEEDPRYWMPKETHPEERGTPLLGRIKSSGEAEADEDWEEAWGRRLPARFGKGYDIYALELAEKDQCIVFRNIPPWEFGEGMAAVYCWNGYEARGWFGRVRLVHMRAEVVIADGQRRELDPADIVRIGKVVGRWPAC